MRKGSYSYRFVHVKSRILILFLSLSPSLFIFTPAGTQNGSSTQIQPPLTERKPKITEINGDRLIDNYFWLREKTNPAVVAHLEAENAYATAVMKPTEALQEKLYNEILSHVKQPDTNVPTKLGQHFYFSKTQEGLQYPTFFRRRGSLDAPAELVLDLNELAKGEKFLSIWAYVPSDDGNLVAFS